MEYCLEMAGLSLGTWEEIEWIFLRFSETADIFLGMVFNGRPCSGQWGRDCTGIVWVFQDRALLVSRVVLRRLS